MRDALKLVALTAAYFAVARLGLASALAPQNVPLVWLASGVALAALILWGLRFAPAVFLGASLAIGWQGLAPVDAVCIGVGNALAALAGAWLLTRAYEFRSDLARVRDVFLLIFPAALGTTVIAATIGTATLFTSGLVSPERIDVTWLAWWGSDAQGILFVTPALLAWAARPRPDRRTVAALATAVAIALGLLFSSLILEDHLGAAATRYLVSFALFPLAVWPALRLPIREVATLNLVVAALCVAGASRNIGPFAGGADAASLLVLHGLLSFVALTTLLVCAGGAERREAVERLSQSEGRFRNLIDLSADWYWEQDEQFRFTWVSEGFLRHTGFDPSNCLGKTRWEIPYVGREGEAWVAHRRQMEAHQPFRDFLLVRPAEDGALRYSVVSGEPVLDGAGRFRGYRGVGRDITAQKSNEVALKESQELFARLFDDSPIPMMFRRLNDGIVNAVNDAWCRFYGRDRDAVLGRPVGLLALTADRADSALIQERVDRQGTVRDLELRVCASGGEVREVLFSAEVVELRGEKAVISTAVDVTERNRALVELSASRQRFEQLFRASPQPIAISGIDDGAVIDVSEAWTRTYGYARDEILGRNFINLGLWVDLGQREQLREQLLARGALSGFECRWRRKSGEIADVLFFAEIVDIGGVKVMLSTGMDISERKRQERLLGESETRVATIFQSSPVPVVISGLADGRYREVNAAGTRFFGYARGEFLGLRGVDLGIWLTAADRDTFVAALREGRPLRDVETRLRKKSGEIADVLLSAELIELDGESCVLTSVMDISDRKLAERALRESEHRFRDFAEAAGEYVWELDAEGRYTFLSKRVEAVLGYAPEDMYGRRPTDFMPPGEDERMRAWYASTAAACEPFRNVEHRALARSGSQVWQSVSGVPILDGEGRATGFRGTALEITERKRAEQRIAELATRDPLTLLPNRLLLNDRIAQGLVNAQREASLLAVMFIDLDHFKGVNDTLGHDVGDLLLQEVARRIGAVLRKGDTLSRLGGDEFVVLLEELKVPEDAAQVAQKILNALARDIELAGHTLHTGASIGIAAYPADGADGSTLMRHADTAMYAAKSSGRRNFQFFSSEMNARATERVKMEGALRHALEAGELRVYYQPRVEVATNHLTGVEALLRWQHPEHGVLSAGRFMRFVEEAGLVHAIGEWMLRGACNQAASLHALYGPAFALSVNVSAKQFNTALVGRVQAALDESGLDAQLLELELSETVLARSPDDSKAVLARLRRLGVRVVIDDFGTGYSSLGEMRRYGIDGIKIDRTLVRGIASSPDDRIVVKAIIEMARSLRINTIAEGVESADELAVLRQMGCEEYLGHLHAEPMPPGEFERRFLRAANIVNFPKKT